MSGTSWFDLSSIQEQINKSILEASKIAEDASRYDLLNFDEMAKQSEEEEDDDDNQDMKDGAVDQYDTSNNKICASSTVTGKCSHDSVQKKNQNDFNGFYRIEEPFKSAAVSSKAVNSGLKSIILTSIDSIKSSTLDRPHDLSSKSDFETIYSTSTNQGDRNLNENSDRDFEASDSALSSPSSALFSANQHQKFHLENATISANNSHGIDDSIALGTPPCFAKSVSFALISSNGTDHREIDCYKADENSNTGILNHKILSPDSAVYAVDDEVADSFFGVQFDTINTIKKEKLTRPSLHTELASVSDDNLRPHSEVQKSEAKENIGGVMKKKFVDLAPFPRLADEPLAHERVQPTIPNKSRKKKKKKGGLDFFGMGNDVSVAAPVASSSLTVEQSVSSSRAGFAGEKTAGFSYFEPVGMLSDDVDEPVSTQKLSEDVWQPLSQSLASSRGPQRLPGIVFSGISTPGDNSNGLSLASRGSAAGKALFSFFDNVEEEIDSNEDPILRQVALNKSNPQSKPRSQTDSYIRTLSAFGITFGSSSSSSSVPMHGGDLDIERDGSPSVSSKRPASTAERESGDAAEAEGGGLSRSSLLESAIVFSSALCGCLATVWLEASNGVGAPLGHRTDLTTRLRRGEAVSVSVPANPSGRDQVRVPLTVFSTITDPEARQLRVLQRRALLLMAWELVSSVTGMSLLTMLLFALSYFKFARYGTDAGD